MMRSLCAALLLLVGCGGKGARPMRFVEALDPPAFPADRRAKILAALPELERIADDGFAQSGAPGMAVGLVVDGELVWSKGYGVRDRETRAPVDADTVFRIASMTKAFTAVAILQLRDAGKLGLDDPAARWVPELAELRYLTRDSRPVTIRDLLSHAGGFPEDNASGDHTLDWSRDRLRARLRRAAMSSSPGSAFEYANLGFMILGLVVERASGEPYTDYVTRHVLVPLGMRASKWNLGDVPRDRATVGYRRRPTDFQLVPVPQLAAGAGSPMGGLHSSLRDLSRFVGWQLGAFPPRDEPDEGPLSRASRREMQAAAQLLAVSRFAEGAEPPATTAQGYGFGLGSAIDCEVGRVVAHSGGLPGFGSFMMWLPDRGVGVVSMTNRTYTSAEFVAIQVLSSLFVKKLLPERVAKASPALLRARAQVDALLAGGDVRAAYDEALGQHGDLDAVARAFAGIRARHGTCRATGDVAAKNALRGGWKLACERGEVEVGVELTVDEKLQAVGFTEKVPPGKPLKAAARLLVRQLASGDPAPLEAIAHPALDRPQARARLAAWRAAGCTLGDPVEGDGVEVGVFAVACKAAAPRTLRVRLADGKLLDFRLRQKIADGCR